MKRKFLVTGANGFVGSCLTRHLVDNGEQVSIIVRNKNVGWRLADIASLLDVYEVDITDPSLSNIVKTINPDIIFHLAAYGSYPWQSDVREMINTNLEGTVNLLRAVKDVPFSLFIHTGSSSEYGTHEKAISEDDLLSPYNDYGVIKAAATLFCQKEGREKNLPIITFRLFSPYGYFEDKNRFIPTVILNALANTELSLSQPDNVRDFIFIEDVISAYKKALEVEIKPGDIFNIGSGKQHTLGEVVEYVVKATGSSSEIGWGAKQNQTRQQEPKNWVADISKAKKIFTFEPQFSLEKGLQKTIEWFKKHNELYE